MISQNTFNNSRSKVHYLIIITAIIYAFISQVLIVLAIHEFLIYKYMHSKHFQFMNWQTFATALCVFPVLVMILYLVFSKRKYVCFLISTCILTMIVVTYLSQVAFLASGTLVLENEIRCILDLKRMTEFQNEYYISNNRNEFATFDKLKESKLISGMFNTSNLIRSYTLIEIIKDKRDDQNPAFIYFAVPQVNKSKMKIFSVSNTVPLRYWCGNDNEFEANESVFNNYENWKPIDNFIHFPD